MLKSVFQYVELTVRVRGKKSFMLVKSDYDSMIAAESVTTALRRLEGTKYHPYITQLLIEEFNLGKVEGNLMKAYLDELNFVLSKLKNKKALEFFKEFNNLIELKTAASILRSIMLGVGWEEALEYLTPYGRFDVETCKSLVEGKNIKNVFQYIEEKKLARKLDEITREIVDPIRQSTEVELTINKHSLTKIWEKMMELEGRDKQSMKLVGLTIDISNIMAVLRLKKLEFKPEEIEAYIIPVYYRLKEEEVKRAVATPTLHQLRKML